MITPSVSTTIGWSRPNAAMLAAILSICSVECVLALFE
jgi:hypothetical protein